MKGRGRKSSAGVSIAVYAEDEFARRFSQALFPCTTNQYGCVTLHSYHFYVEAGYRRPKFYSGWPASN